VKLYEPLPETVEYMGKVYKLDLSFTSVLAALDALENDDLFGEIKLKTALDLLVLDKHPCDSELLRAVTKLIVPNEKQSKEQVMDFEQDWQSIYAAFRQAYGIDLFKEKDMHWYVFSALLKNLPDTTRLASIIDIRQKPIPKPTKGNAEYRAWLMHAKAEFALKRAGQFEKGLQSLFEALKSQAVRR
jgi:hypothetical protein